MLTYRKYNELELLGFLTGTIVAGVWGFQGTDSEPDLWQKRYDGKWHELSMYSDEFDWVDNLPTDALYAVIYDPRKEMAL